MSNPSCRTVRRALYASGGAVVDVPSLAGHVAACPDCETLAASLRAQADVLRAALRGDAPVTLRLPNVDDAMSHPAALSGPPRRWGAWVGIPVAAAASILVAVLLFPGDQRRPATLSDLRILDVDGPEWESVVAEVSAAQALGPGGFATVAVLAELDGALGSGD